MASTGLVAVGSARIEFFADGAGAPVVLVPAGGFDVGYFADLVSRLVGAGLCAVAVNPRGIGRSEGHLEHLTLHTLAADVAGVIEHLGLAPVHLLGHGFSNRVVRCLAADRPDLVRSVVLLAGVGLFEPDPDVVRALQSWFNPEASAADALEAMKRIVADPATAERILASVTRWPGAAAAQAAANRATPSRDWETWTSQAPCLVVQGLADRVAPPGHGRALRAEQGDRVRVVDVPAVGHMLPLEQPEAVAEAVVAFLRSEGHR